MGCTLVFLDESLILQFICKIKNDSYGYVLYL